MFTHVDVAFIHLLEMLCHSLLYQQTTGFLFSYEWILKLSSFSLSETIWRWTFLYMTLKESFLDQKHGNETLRIEHMRISNLPLSCHTTFQNDLHTSGVPSPVYLPSYCLSDPNPSPLFGDFLEGLTELRRRF